MWSFRKYFNKKENNMSKSTSCLLLLMVLVVFTGCQTMHGAATGFNQDVQNISNPDQNGWNALENVDAWMRQNLW
jgi:hypothetical protein